MAQPVLHPSLLFTRRYGNVSIRLATRFLPGQSRRDGRSDHVIGARHLFQLPHRLSLLEASQQRLRRGPAPRVRLARRPHRPGASDPHERHACDDRRGLERPLALLRLLRLRRELDPHVVRPALPGHLRHLRVPSEDLQEVRPLERLGGRDDRVQRAEPAGDGVRVRRDLLARTDVSAVGLVELRARHGQRQRGEHAVSPRSGVSLFLVDFILRRGEGRRERQVGEDNDNVYSLAGSAVQNIVDSVETDGFGFAAKRDLSMWAQRSGVSGRMNGLRSILLTETIVMQDLIDFLQSTSTLSTTNVISLETADTANVGEKRGTHMQEERLLNTCLTLEKGNYTFAYKRLLLAQFMIVSTPGILNFFQGSEYLEDDNFADLPSPLRIKEKVGDGGEQLTGVNAGFFKATKQMLQIRLQYELFNIVKPNIYFINNELSVFAYLRETTSESLVVIVNLSAKDYAEKQWACEGGVMCRIMVDFPSNSALVKWTDLFTTDNPDYYPEFDDLRQVIRLFRCRDHFYDYCGMVSIGPFGVKIMHIAK